MSLLVIVPALLVTGSWKDEFNARRILNWMVLPLFSFAVTASVRASRASSANASQRLRWPLAAMALAYVACLLAWRPAIARQSFALPYPAEVAQLDDFLSRRRLHDGLAGYWNTAYLNVLSRSGVRLRQIQQNGAPYFWNNRALGYYGRDTAGRYIWPAYEFVVADQLDEAALTQVFGEPAERHAVGRYTILIYAAAGRDRIRSALESVVRARLSGNAQQSLLPAAN